MKHFRHLLHGSVLLAIASLPNAPASAAVDNKAYGILAFSDAQYTLANSIVTFDLVSDTEPVFTRAVAFGETSTAGAYADGFYYIAVSQDDGSHEVPKELVKVNLSTGSHTVTGSLEGYNNLINDMSYDPSTATMYAVSRIDNSVSGLYSINLSDASSTLVATLDRRFFTLASSYSGQLYGISFEGMFCAIDKNTGAVTEIGHTGHYPQKFQSMEFDHSTRMLWWIASTRKVNESGTMEVPESFVATIDTATGAVTRHQEFGDNQLAGLYIPAFAAADNCPAQVTRLTVTPDPTGLSSVTLSWTNPTTTFGGDILKALTGVEIARDGEVVATVTNATPGAASSYTDNIGGDSGASHVWTVTPLSSNGRGVPAEIAAFAGRDIPAAVAAVNIEKTGPNSATVTWTPVTTGANGGWTDTASMLYDVTRNPGAVKVADGIAECRWTEPGVETSGTYTYSVTARNSCGVSAVTTSQPVTLGPTITMPYACDFGEDDFGQWTAVDGNADDNTWQLFTISWAKAEGAYLMTANNAGDDWLVSNDMLFEPNSTYKVKLTYLANGEHPLSFSLVRNGDPQQTVADAGAVTLQRGWQTETTEWEFSTGDEAGECGFAIHDTAAQGNSYVLLDRIEIEQVVADNLAALSILGNPQPVEGNTYGYTVEVANKGTRDCASYTVELIDSEGATLETAQIGETLAPGATRSVTIDYTVPRGSSLTGIRGRVTAPGDGIAADNLTDILAVTVLPFGSAEEITIGTKKGTSYYHPMNLRSTYGASLNIYDASELSVKSGRISAIRLENDPLYGVDNLGVKVYLANTSRTKASEGWIAEEDMTLVYDGSVDLPKGANTLELPFARAFDYRGGNLAVLMVTSLANSGSAYTYVSQPYYTSPVAGNNAVTYGGDAPFAFSGTQNAQSGCSVITLMVQSGGASITGTVTDAEGAPLADATVSVAEINAETTSLADGSYKFDFVPNGNYTVSASMFGYESGEPVSVAVDDSDATADLSLTKLPVYAVTGRAVAPDGTPVAGATVSLTGYTDLSAETAEDGTFAFADVVTHEQTSVSVAKAWYIDAVETFSLQADADLGDMTLGYAHFAPVNVTADIDGDNATVSWQDASADAELRYDSGVAETQIGFSNQVGMAVIGTVFRTPMTLTSVKWMTTEEGGPHNSVNIYVYDLDDAGEPVGTLLYSERAVINTDGEWTTLVLPEPVEAPRGCMVSVNYPGFHGLAVDGDSKSYPLRDHVYAFSTDYTSGEFAYFDAESLGGNLLVRALGQPYSSELTTASRDTEVPDFVRYNLYRSEGYDSDVWTAVNDTPADASPLADESFATAPAGVYRYAVTAVYPDGSESGRTESRYITRDMLGSIALSVVTNSRSGLARGAVVTITGSDPADTRTAVISDDATASFDGIWRDSYQLSISLPGYAFEPVTADITGVKDLDLGELVLKEIIATPVNLAVTGDTENGYRLTWNESGRIFDGFEDHTPFTVASAGEVGWQYRDADGARTFAEQEFDFPGRTQPCSFMVFNPWMTLPSMADARSAALPYEGENELACFAGYTGSDDWFISPRLTYHEDFPFSFYARGYSQTYGEVIRVGYSLTDTEPGSFTWIGGEIDVPRQLWNRYEFTIPAKARYVAVNCISPDGFTLFIDNVEIAGSSEMMMNTAVTGPEVSYEISLDGSKVADTDECSYMFTGLEAGEHEAEIRATYASGASEAASIVFGSAGIGGVTYDAVGVWPNPAHGYTNVRGEFRSARLYDLSGRQVAAYDGNDSRLDLGDVAPGLYMLTIEPAKGRPVTVKLTVR